MRNGWQAYASVGLNGHRAETLPLARELQSTV